MRSPLPGRWALAVLLAVLGIGFLITIVLVFAGQEAARLRAREALLRDLNNLKPTYRVQVNGRDTIEPAAIVAALRAVTTVPAHHSGPERPFLLDISDGEYNLLVTLAEDSQRPHEFWVFRPPPKSSPGSLGQEVGRITDPQLRRYLAGR